MRDMGAKGRSPFEGRDQQGEANEHARLTDDVVREIVVAFDEGWNNKIIGAAVGVTHSMISAIRRGKAWTHVTGIERTKTMT